MRLRGILEGEEIKRGHVGQVSRLRGVTLEGEKIGGGHFGQVRRLRGGIWKVRRLRWSFWRSEIEGVQGHFGR